MCQPKSQGGKRCLRHQAGTKATVRYTEAKLKSIEKEDIYATLKELNKEGRNLEAPETEEVLGFLAKEKFKTQLDPELEEKERKLILKNLEKAAEEAAEQETSGGAFHAWKNLFKRSLEKMRKPLTVFAAGALLAGGLAGCTGGQIPEPSNTNGNPTTAYSLDIGDAVGGPEVTDNWGTYQKLLVDPKGSAYTFDEKVVDKASLTANGFTIEDAKKAQIAAVKYLVEDTTDNPAIDVPEADFPKVYGDWLTKNKSSIYEGDWVSTSDISKGSQLFALPEAFVRDGKPRVETLNIKVNQVKGYAANTTGQKGITVTATITAGYRVTDAYLNNLAKEYNLDLGADTNGILTDGKANIVTVEREALINIAPTDDLIAGVNFPAMDTREAFNVANLTPSKW
jgi:hypothetical protein